jgi:hypothetical protein
LDEAEAIPNIGGTGVASAYSNLAALIDAAQRIEQIYFIYATTPTFFGDVRRYAPEIAAAISDNTRMDLSTLRQRDYDALTEKVAHLLAIDSDGAIDEMRVIRKGKELAVSEMGTGAGPVRNYLTALFASVNGT